MYMVHHGQMAIRKRSVSQNTGKKKKRKKKRKEGRKEGIFSYCKLKRIEKFNYSFYPSTKPFQTMKKTIRKLDHL